MINYKISNDKIIEMFTKIVELKNSGNYLEIKKIHDEIINNMFFMVYNITGRYRKFDNYNDLLQEGFIGLIKAVKNFDSSLFPNFFIFAEQCIKHYVKRAASKFDIVYNPDRKRTVYCGLEDINFNEMEDDFCLDNFIFEKEKIQYVRESLDSLNLKYRNVIEKIFFKDMSLRDIGKDMKITHERVRQIKNQALLRLSKFDTIKIM